MSEVPDVLVLKPITPSVDSSRQAELKYDKLAPAIDKYASDDKARQAAFWNAEEESLEELQAAEQLAKQYLLMSAGKLNFEAVRPETKKLWSDRYTRAASEIYGTPETDLSREFLTNSVNSLFARALDLRVDNELLDHFKLVYENFGFKIEQSEQKEPMFRESAEKLGQFLNEKYSQVYAALELDDAPAQIDPASIATMFESAVSVLAENHDEAWRQWAVVREVSKDSLSVVGSKKQILVGMNRASVTPKQLKGLFSHEVLLHGQRSVNGKKISKELGSGLPGYLDAEEGIGTFFEYAITGDIPEKNIDRYVDIALALGCIDARQHSRQELCDFAMTRALIRNELKSKSEKQSDDDVQKSVYAHVNRIYRGSLGDENIGIFTKDTAYNKGFVEIGRYVEEKLSQGQTIGEIINYLLKGKFDPNNPKHVQIVEAS